MAYDPQARDTSNTAMVIGIVALVVVVLGALAYWATRPGETPTTTFVTSPNPQVVREKETIREVPGPGTTTVIQQPAANPAPVVRSETKVDVKMPPTSSAKSSPAGDSKSSNTTVINNNPPASSSTPSDTNATSNSASSDSAPPAGAEPKY